MYVRVNTVMVYRVVYNFANLIQKQLLVDQTSTMDAVIIVMSLKPIVNIIQM